MKKKRLPPDKRLDWRDPEMPALEGKFQSPEIITKGARIRLDMTLRYEEDFPSWRNDPSYHWAKKKK